MQPDIDGASYAKRAQLYRPHSPGEMKAAVHRLAREGYGDYIIASATRLSVEIVRQVLAERRCNA